MASRRRCWNVYNVNCKRSRLGYIINQLRWKKPELKMFPDCFKMALNRVHERLKQTVSDLLFWVIFTWLYFTLIPPYLNHKHPSVLSGSGCHDSSCSSHVTKHHGPEDVWAVDCSKPCPSHPSLLGRLTTSGGTAVWVVTPTCQP